MLKGPSRATAVRGFVPVQPGARRPCSVCGANVGKRCTRTRGGFLFGEPISGYHESRSLPLRPKQETEPKAKPEVKKSIDFRMKTSVPMPDPPEGWGAGYGTNAGHGHVWKRPDLMKINCGRWRKCLQCRAHREYCIRYSSILGITDQL